MEVENMSSSITSKKEEDHQDDDVPLPGFRFHPTDEELVGFYLKRKVEKRPIRIELIKQADIYKYDPWDLPKTSSNAGDKEWYFFCKRGRKYRNSIRPNRVTGSGFWKATGIDRPIYSSGGEGRDCIGLKKSLVYYRGSAGKGTKTDWMMHEFRLPSAGDKSTKNMDAKTIAEEAEVWTICRIFKRNISYKKCVPDWREMAAKKTTTIVYPMIDSSSKTCSSSIESSDQDMPSSYISFSAPVMKQNDKKPHYPGHADESTITNANQQFFGHFSSQAPVLSATSSFSSSVGIDDMHELLRMQADWEDLRSIVDCAAVAANHNPFY